MSDGSILGRCSSVSAGWFRGREFRTGPPPIHLGSPFLGRNRIRTTGAHRHIDNKAGI